MSMRQVVKNFFTACEGHIELWGTSLHVSEHLWVIDKRHRIWREPLPSVKALESLVTATRDADYAVVLIPPRVFNILVVEGIISLDQLDSAEEDLNEPSVTVRDVRIAGKNCTIRTIPSDEMIMRFGCELMVIVNGEYDLEI
ncbi:MAG: hypothetical protein UZ21_OP11001000033 [Microgenomates bacterium OLB22]|nr:MAG: hypothetical protein UZ21_OP11001000033 [Microgenomates bacterium OLB22]